jgi:hypothetical protein
MADTKITALTALTAADPANDVIPIVDVSDTTMAASGTTKKISVNNILSSSPTASGALTVTGLVTAGSATITGDLTVDTSTLKVDSTNNRVGIVQATPLFPLDVSGSGVTNTPIRLISASGTSIRFDTGRDFGGVNRNWIVGCDEVGESVFAIVPSTAIGGSTFTNPVYKVNPLGVHTFLDGAGGTQMTLNSTGLLIGTANGTGDITNATRTTGGIFTTINNLTAFVSSGAATTIFAAPSESTLIVTTSLNGSTDPVNYNAVAIVKVAGGVATITTISSAVLMTITISGLNVQATQTSGGAGRIVFTVLRIA